jgi:hypothetical protein
MRRCALVVVALTSIAVATAVTASSAPAAVAKSCPAGFVHATLTWGEKCLHAGEFCKIGNAEYRRYGFVCPASGHLGYAGTSASANPKSTSRPGTTTPTATTTSTTTRSTPTPPATTTTPPAAPPPATTTTAPAAVPAPPPSSTGPTALCKDGTLSYSATHSGTCSGHGGVAVWYR